MSTSGGNSTRAGVLALALLAAGGSACVTAGQGEVMRSDIAELRTRLDAIDRRDKEYTEQVARLRKVLDEATALLTRNSADLGAKVARSEAEMAALAGKLDELRHELEQVGKQLADERSRTDTRVSALSDTQAKLSEGQTRLTERLDRLAPPIPEDKDTLWKEASTRLAAGQRDDARRFYRSFLQRFPQDPRAPQALIAIAQSLDAEGKQAQAAGELQKVLDQYPKSPEVPEAMWMLADAYVDLKFCSDARALLSDLVKRFPKSPRAEQAKERIKQLGKIARDKTKCTS